MSLSQLSVYSVVLYSRIRTLFAKRVLLDSHTIFHDKYHEVFRVVDHDIFLWDELKVRYWSILWIGPGVKPILK